jgi:hypothetical protein
MPAAKTNPRRQSSACVDRATRDVRDPPGDNRLEPVSARAAASEHVRVSPLVAGEAARLVDVHDRVRGRRPRAVGNSAASSEAHTVAEAPLDSGRLGRDRDRLARERYRELLDLRGRVEPEPGNRASEPRCLGGRTDAARQQWQPIGDRGSDGRWIDARRPRPHERVARGNRARRVRADLARTDRVPEAARAEWLGILGECRVCSKRRIRVRQVGARAALSRTPR